MSNLTTAIQLTKSSTYKLNNGLHIPVAGFGVYQIPVAQTADLVYQALVDGYRHIDSGVLYNNEAQAAEGIARFLKDHPHVTREQVWFTTKITTAQQGYEETKKAILEIAHDIKKHIGYVDLVLIHSPATNKEKRLATWKALQEFQIDPNNGVLAIKSIGVSNFGVTHLQEIFDWDELLVKPVVNQIELHPWKPQLELRKYLIEHDIVAEAYSPLTQGEHLDDPELLELEKKYKVSKIEILLKWSYLQGFVVLAKTSKKDRIKQNLGILPDDRTSDALEEETHLGKVDLEPGILEVLDKPDSHVSFTWGGEDLTAYKDQ